MEVNPKELEVSLNSDGLVPAFNFQGQPWPAVVQWYAKLANCSSDWQELPNDYINVFTERPMALDEVRNRLNQFLLARGFAMLQRDRAVSVYKLENIEPSQVDLVSEIQLYERKPYDIAKTAFQLPKKMDISKAKDDLKQVLSPKAKVVVLVTTRQALIIDAVANLQAVSQLLNEERAVEDDKSPIREFVLKYRRAEDVIDILYITLGLDPKSKPSQMELQLQQQKLQIMQQMAQRGADMAGILKKDGPPVFLAYNRQKNSVIANAPDEQMQMIDDAIKMLDVPIGGEAPDKGATAEPPVDRTIKTATFKLKTLNPQSLATTLEEIGGLDPFTVIKADATARSIFVQGIAADHQRIQKLIDELDGEERDFKMIQLKNYSAEEAAITIRELIAGKKEEKEDGQDAYYKYLTAIYSSSRGNQKEDPHEGFYVAADVVHNRLLVKANKLEMELITNLLKELGEVPTQRRDGVATRVLDAPGGDILEKLRRAWGQTEGNPLVIDGAGKSSAKDEGSPPIDKDEKDGEQPAATSPANDRGVGAERPPSTAAVFAHFASPAVDGVDAPAPESKFMNDGSSTTEARPTVNPPKTSEPPKKTAGGGEATEPKNVSATSEQADLPPVSITVTDDGRFVIRSTDPDAVERMEALIGELSPPAKRVKVFPVKHQKAYNINYSLQEIFEEELKDDSQPIRDWYGQYQRTSGRDNGTGLGKRPKLIIDYDPWINAILVSNASAAQLREIGDLIAEFDQEPAADKVRSRRSAAIKVNHSKASIIAAALKEVYIDWLTTRDREFDSGDGNRQSGSTVQYLTDVRFGEKSNGKSDQPIRTGVTFNGELSIGVDDISNNILISCQDDLFDGVVDMIHKLDEESAPQMSIVVQPLSGTYDGAQLQKTMEDTVGKPWLGSRPEDMQTARGGGAGQPQPGQNGGQNNNNRPQQQNRGRRR